MARVLIIEDETSIRKVLTEIITEQKELGAMVESAKNGDEGLQMLESGNYDVVLCDIRMPGTDGMEVLRRAKEAGNQSAFIMISAHGNTEMAVDAVRLGAYDFLQKPPDLNRLLITLRNALDRTSLVKETKVLRKKVSRKYEMTGNSPELGEVRQVISKVAPTDLSLIHI